MTKKTDNIPLDQELASVSSFFELLRRLETTEQRFGRSGGPKDEPARLAQAVRLSFATRDVEGIEWDQDSDCLRVEQHVLGLLGPEGPMPLHMTRWVMNRLSNRWFGSGEKDASSDKAFLNFCNMLQHRLISLYWRAWADARMDIQYSFDTGGKVGAVFATLAGVGLPGKPGQLPESLAEKLRHGTSLANETQGVARLTGLLQDILKAPVQMKEFIGTWRDIPQPLQSRLGKDFARLGGNLVVGRRVFGRQDRVELRVGPLSLDKFTALFSDTQTISSLRHAIIFAAGLQTEFDLRLVLDKTEIPKAQLGSCQLSRTTWLNPDQDKNPDDLRLACITAETDLMKVAA